MCVIVIGYQGKAVDYRRHSEDLHRDEESTNQHYELSCQSVTKARFAAGDGVVSILHQSLLADAIGT
jgi:hypothetical protein